MLVQLVLSFLVAAPADTIPVESGAIDSLVGPRVELVITGARLDPELLVVTAPLSSPDTVRRRPRPRAIEYSDWYERRATIHRLASWATIPLFAAEVVTGEELFKNGPEAADWAQDSHGIVAASLAGLFAVNTVTGAWNLWDARHDPNGRKWRTAHAVLMLAADAGFAYAATLAEDAEESSTKRRQHRTIAITSSSVALLSYVMMLPPLRRD